MMGERGVQRHQLEIALVLASSARLCLELARAWSPGGREEPCGRRRAAAGAGTGRAAGGCGGAPRCAPLRRRARRPRRRRRSRLRLPPHRVLPPRASAGAAAALAALTAISVLIEPWRAPRGAGVRAARAPAPAYEAARPAAAQPHR
jgi:hypothetical protein